MFEILLLPIGRHRISTLRCVLSSRKAIENEPADPGKHLLPRDYRLFDNDT